MHITHKDILHFAEEKVNLPSKHAKKYRDQVRDLREKLEAHIKDNEDYRLRKILFSGSLAKSTSLKDISDADVALYIQPDDDIKKRKEDDMEEFIRWLADELATFYRHISQKDIEPKKFSISIYFENKDLEIDVVPILLLDENTWDGELTSPSDETTLKTNIPRHIEFMKTRNEHHPMHFRQVIRLLKYWAGKQKKDNPDFRFKSFMIELIVAHLADKNKITLDDYPEAMRQFFDYLMNSRLNDVISFNDFGHGSVTKQDTPINIFDPVNKENNVAELYTQKEKELILEEARKAAEAIETASCVPKKNKALQLWQKVFGSTFTV